MLASQGVWRLVCVCEVVWFRQIESCLGGWGWGALVRGSYLYMCRVRLWELLPHLMVSEE